MQDKLISIVIPVYKSSDSLIILKKQLDKLFIDLDYEYEIIFVNDSPREIKTAKVLEKIKKEDQLNIVKIIRMNRNMGQQYALLCGISKAKGDYIITMDDDLQHPVSEIPKLIIAIEDKQVDLIFANPKYKDKRHNLFRNIGSWMVNKIDDIFMPQKPDVTIGAFRIFNSKIIPTVLNSYSSYPSLSNLLINSSNAIINMEVKHQSREFGKSNYTTKTLISLALDNLINYTSLPLALLGFLGVICFIASGIFIISIAIQRIFFSISMPGYASTVILISFFGSLNLLGIGIIGEYLIRIIREQHKPKLETLFSEEN